MTKIIIGLIGAVTLTGSGIILRLKAHSMAWPSGGVTYSGLASETIYGRQEIAIGQIAIALMLAGILILVVTYSYWLFCNQSEK
jgi:hypothetical protein